MAGFGYRPPISPASPEAIEDAVNTYLTANPPEVAETLAPVVVSVRSTVPIAEFGGSISGSTLTVAAFSFLPPDSLVWTFGDGDRWWSHVADGEFAETTSPATMGNFLAGRRIVVAFDYATSDPADGLLSVWHVGLPDGVTPTLIRTSFIPTRDLAELEELQLSNAAQGSLAASLFLMGNPPTAWFQFDDELDPDLLWESTDLPELTGLPDIRALIWYDPATDGAFAEAVVRFFDDGTIEDSPELAIFNDAGVLKVFMESVAGGATSDEVDVLAPWDVAGRWVPVRVFYEDGECVAQVGVRGGGDTTTDGRWTKWATIGRQDRSPRTGMEFNPIRPWIIGNRWLGRIAWAEIYDGPDGTLVAAPDAADWTSGLSFTDSEGNEWTTVAGVVGTP